MKDKPERKNPVASALDRKIKLIVDGPLMPHQKAAFEAVSAINKSALKSMGPSIQMMSTLAAQHTKSVQAALNLIGPSNQMTSALIAANRRIALGISAHDVVSWQQELSKLHKSWTAQLASNQSMINGLNAVVGVDFRFITRNLQMAEFMRMSLQPHNWSTLNIPSSILKQFRVDEAGLSNSLRCAIDAITTPTDYLKQPCSVITGASRDVFTSSHAVSTLFPTVQEEVPFDLDEVVQQAQDETRECDSILASLAPELLRSYHGAHDALNSTSSDKVRHTFVSLRHLIDTLYDKLAPKTDVKQWVSTTNRKSQKKSKVTREDKVLYIVRNNENSHSRAIIESNAARTDSLFNLLNSIHENNPNYTNKFLKRLVLHVESHIYFLYDAWKESQ